MASAAKFAPLVIVGPSGVGKSVLVKTLREIFPGKMGFSVSSTTREARPGEENGVHYHFTTHDKMKEDIGAGKFVEHADVHGNMYGTSRQAVQDVIEAGKVCILDIDVQGAKTIYDQKPFEGTRFIFVFPPDMEELERRLRGRGTETEEKIQKRLANAVKEIEFAKTEAHMFDHTFVMDTASEGRIPKGSLSFFPMMQKWFPSLGSMPTHMEVLCVFEDCDKGKSGYISKGDLVQALLNLDSSCKENEIQDMLGELAGGTDQVDYQLFLKDLYKDVADAGKVE